MSKRRHKYTLETAILEARRIRRNLQKMPQWKTDQLAGACGLASILLSISLGDVGILRSMPVHVWAEVSGTIIDITASQFNETYVMYPPVKGTLITKTPRAYHHGCDAYGFAAYKSIVNQNWYTKRDHANWRWIADYWM